MTPEIMNRYSAYRAACKQWSVGLGVLILLVTALASLPARKLLWVAAPLLLLGLVEASYAAQQRRCSELLQAKKGDAALSPESANASMVRTTFAVLSLSIWPFYLGLFALVAIGGEQMTAPARKGLLASTPQGAQPASLMRTVTVNKGSGGCGSGGCGSGGSGGCGKSGSCGSGGCGSGGCSSGGGMLTAPMSRPLQSYPAIAPQQAQMLLRQAQAQTSMAQRLPNGALVAARPPAFPGVATPIPAPSSATPAPSLATPEPSSTAATLDKAKPKSRK